MKAEEIGYEDSTTSNEDECEYCDGTCDQGAGVALDVYEDLTLDTP
jgi:hypothetical protein